MDYLVLDQKKEKIERVCIIAYFHTDNAFHYKLSPYIINYKSYKKYNILYIMRILKNKLLIG